MVCPTKLSTAPGGAEGDENTVISQIRPGETTNQRDELTGRNDMNQSTAGPAKKRNKT